LISFIKGILVEKSPARVVVEAGGVGHEILVPLSSYDRLGPVGSEVTVRTHFHVREDAHELYGFATEKERWLFKMLITISGIGPRSALTILSGAGVDEFCDAIVREDTDSLTAISGIGKKTAQRLIVELKTKISEEEVEIVGAGRGAVGQRDAVAEAVQALVALGFPAHIARKAVERCAGEGDKELGVEELVRSALKNT
jgi:Holliday junction DNA helicase RuvA